jgi:hypothetical protein
MPHSQARNGIKFTEGLQLLNTLMSAGCDIRCCNEKINHRRTRVVHSRFSQLSFYTRVHGRLDPARAEPRALRIHARGRYGGLIHFG